MRILDCRPMRKTVIEHIKEELVPSLKGVPTLGIIQVGEEPSSTCYVRNKEKLTQEVGMRSVIYNLAEDITQEELEEWVVKMASNPKIHGVMLQLPLPEHLDATRAINLIPQEKDVDGLTVANQGLIMTGDLSKAHLPCTPLGIMELLGYLGFQDLSRHDVVVVGRSNLFGNPMAQLLMRANATVTLCHSRTMNLQKKMREADIIICGAGCPGLVNELCLSSKTKAVIDVGMTLDPRTKKFVGDVNIRAIEEVLDNAPFREDLVITPTPGGTGQLTVPMLLLNTIRAFEMLDNE